jgi:hypothetical protein
MIEDTPLSVTSCANEGCSRPAEAGEAYCGACGLERSLFRRDSRYAGERSRTEPRPEPARR